MESGTIYNSYFKMKRELDYISVGLLRTIREYFYFNRVKNLVPPMSALGH